ncbi:MAG: iron export ABC transporter permease subunit FetB [Clostridia bacterium]|nr:iron export ABC transporter permease subunit FetB [Clostridia bacterium]
MESIIDLHFWQLAAAYIFILILMFLVRFKGIPREKDILISSLRMTFQLILVGYVLSYVFDNSNPLFTILIICLMETFAIFNIYKRAKIIIPKRLKKIIALSMVTGSISCLLYFLLIVVRISPWYDPRYFIPIAGMIVGNSMTGVTLGVNRLVEGINSQKHKVEAALMLGATPKAASRQIVNNAFDSAILPTVNSMVGMGIISLPGMMTGQILSGTSPLVAVKYQIAIMLGILGSVSLTVFIFLQLGYMTFFNSRSQLEV